ncbi:MAG TPA: ATP-binding protein [Kofleriaceae bacterium]|nr:ATP-binding protein [Kofleriaceae bacterium]
MKTSAVRVRWSSGALVAAALLMGGALVATVWSTRRGVRDASEMLVRGHSDSLLDGIRMRMFALDGPPTRESLAALLEELRPDGLRYLAQLDRHGAVLADAGVPASGTPPTSADLAGVPSGSPVAIEDRIRVVMRRVPNQALRRAVRARVSDRERLTRLERARLREQMREQRLGPLVIEFEPAIADELHSATDQSLAIGTIAAGALLIGALVLIRWILHRESLVRRLEHERRLASLGEMSAVMAHEIRNPLASLKGNAQLLARSLPEGERARAKADRVVHEAIRLESLTNDLLEFARTGAIAREEVDPAAVLREAAAAFDEPRVTVEADGAPARWSLDPARMRQVLGNLIENALEAGDGEVTATVTAEGDRLSFAVRDRGAGFAPEVLPRVFEPFFTQRTHGTGLGLAVARRLVELHGGTIVARNHPDGGAELLISIPRG